MPSLNTRLITLEKRPPTKRPHGMTQEALALHMEGLSPREQAAFIQSMTDDDLSARIDYLTTLSEQHHAKP